jgi:hypothetical protein
MTSPGVTSPARSRPRWEFDSRYPYPCRAYRGLGFGNSCRETISEVFAVGSFSVTPCFMSDSPLRIWSAAEWS